MYQWAQVETARSTLCALCTGHSGPAGKKEKRKTKNLKTDRIFSLGNKRKVRGNLPLLGEWVEILCWLFAYLLSNSSPDFLQQNVFLRLPCQVSSHQAQLMEDTNRRLENTRKKEDRGFLSLSASGLGCSLIKVCNCSVTHAPTAGLPLGLY